MSDQFDTMFALLTDKIEQYKAAVILAGGDRSTTQERLKNVRISLEANPRNVTIANHLAEAVINVIAEECDTDDNRAAFAAVYRIFTEKVIRWIKEERDLYLNGFDGNALKRSSEIPVTPEQLTELKTVADSLFTVLNALNPERMKSSALETVKSDKTGQVSLKLPRIPKGFGASTNVDRTLKRTIIKKQIWTVDSAQYPGYSMAMMRKIIGVDTVADIQDAMDWHNKDIKFNDGSVHYFTCKGKSCSYQVVSPFSDAEVAALESDNDESEDSEDIDD